MIAENSDLEALRAQADIHRFFAKVIQPALEEFVPTDDIVGLETDDMDVFLDAAQANTHNALCHEMRRTFALILGAMFERQLRCWLVGKLPAKKREVEQGHWPDLVKLVEKITSRPIGPDLDALWAAANAVRHGNGPSATRLLQSSPLFWNHLPTQTGSNWRSDLVGNMRIGDADLQRCAIAVMQFWHLAGASSVPL